MRKFLLILAVLLVACSEKNGGIEEEPPVTIDEALIGTWKVEYSKTINPAIYIMDEEELADRLKSDPDAKLGLNYPEDAIIKEYFGDPLSELTSHMFDDKEDAIEITLNNQIKIYWFDIDGSLHEAQRNISYKIEDGYFKWQPHKDLNNIGVNKYYFDGDELVMDLVKAEGVFLTYYVISRYSKVE